MSPSSTSSSDADDGVRVPAGERLGIRAARPSRRRGARRRVVVSAAVVIVALLGAELVLRALPPLPRTAVWPDPEVNLKADALRHRARGGVVYVGSSIIDAAIDPRVVATLFPTAAGSYNAALEGADAQLMIAWITRVLVPRVHPKVVVIGLSPRELNDGGRNQQNFRTLFFGSRGWREAVGKRTWSDRATSAAEHWSVLIRERGRLRSPKSAIDYWRTRRAEAWNPPIVASTGRLTRHDVSTGYQRPDPGTRDMVFNNYRTTDNLAVLRQGIDELHRLGIAVVVLLPAQVRSDLAVVLSPSLIDAADRAVADVAGATCSPLVDLRTSLPDLSNFTDALHVNHKGAVAESRLVGQALNALSHQGRLHPGCNKAHNGDRAALAPP